MRLVYLQSARRWRLHTHGLCFGSFMIMKRQEDAGGFDTTLYNKRQEKQSPESDWALSIAWGILQGSSLRAMAREKNKQKTKTKRNHGGAPAQSSLWEQ